MAALQINGNWDDIKERLQQKYSDLTEDDLSYEEGQEEELLERLESKTGQPREEFIRSINRYTAGEMDDDES